MLDRDSILAAEDLPRQTVEVPEWGGVVLVRMMSAGERQDYIKLALKGGKAELAEISTEAALVAMTACGDDGKLLFAPADIPALTGKSAAAVSRIAKAAAELNQIGTAPRKAAAKN